MDVRCLAYPLRLLLYHLLMKILLYKIATGTTSTDLEQRVKQMMAYEGMQPIGGLCYMPLPERSHTPFMLCQAMAKFDTEAGSETAA